MKTGMALTLLWIGMSAQADALPVDEGMCRNGGFPLEQDAFTLARVTGKPRLHFLDDMEGCPSKGEAACRQRGYVIEGDTLIVGRAQGHYRCVFYPNKGGGSAGWVPEDRLRRLPLPTAIPLQAWAGHWQGSGDNTLDLIPNGDGTVTMNGDAYWPSANPDPEMRPGGPHLGSVTARDTPQGNRLEVIEGGPLEEYRCKVTAHLLGDLLVVADNSNCGGANVSFSGVYRRTP